MNDDRPVSEQALELLSQAAGEALSARGWQLVSAESCTGGWIAQCMTANAGSSAWFDCAMVVYSNAAKSQLLGVPTQLIAEHGAVSEAVVRAMAGAALRRSEAQMAVAVSGVAGPGGGSDDKPVGTVWLAFAGAGGGEEAARYWYPGDRRAVRAQAVRDALAGIIRRCDDGAASPGVGQRR